MKGAIVAALMGSAVAAVHNGHAGFHVRRNQAAADVCTVYKTVYVYPSDIPSPVANSTLVVSSTAFESSSTPCPTSNPSPPSPPSPESPKDTPAPPPQAYAPPPQAYAPAPPAYAPQPAPPKEEPTPAPIAPAPPSPPANTPQPTSPSASAPSKPAGNPSYSGRIVSKGGKWGMTYTPYTTDGQCKSASEVQTDIAAIAALGFTTIRSYSTDCGVFENVVPACKAHGLKVIYGIFLEGGGKAGKGPFSDYANQQCEEIVSKADKDSVAMVIVGNEFLFNGYGTAQDLGSYIDYVRQQFQGAGFPNDIPITTTEPVGTWESQGKDLCSHIDLFTAQVQPFFTSTVSAADAGTFAASQLEQAAKVCPEAAAKGKYITEIGWPKAGNANGAAQPGVEQQKEAMKSIISEVGTVSVVFSYQDDKWKAPGEYDVEQNFGCTQAISS